MNQPNSQPNKLGRKKIRLCQEVIGSEVQNAFMGGAGFPAHIAVCVVRGEKEGVWFVHLKKRKAVQFLNKGKICISRIKGQYKKRVLHVNILEDVSEYMDESELEAFRNAVNSDLT